MNKRARSHSALMNNRTYSLYYNTLVELSLARFKWENLPSTCDERFLELQLHSKGQAIYFRDEVMGDLTLSCMIHGELDVYNIPIKRTAFATNGYSMDLDKSNSVLIFNNYMHTPTDQLCRIFAYYIYEIQRAIDVNVKGQKTPRIVLCSEQQKLTMQNLMMMYDGNIPLIYGDKSIDLDSIKIEDLTSPYVADKMIILKHQLWNEALTYLGIENSNQDKRERLVADEVGSNYGNVEASRFIYLNERNKAARAINEMFGTNISVRFNSELTTMLNLPNLGKESYIDERIYDTNTLDSRAESE